MASDFADFSYIAPLISPDASSSRNFSHKPLSSSENIRLLKIHAGDLNERVATTIYQIQLETAPPYEAISYTWGSESGMEEIACGSDSYRIRVTKNCESVLRRLRRPDEDRLVWIDAICIDQTNIEERNAQVAIMGQIYKTASRIIIDIGETFPNANSALDCIIHCSDEWCSKFSPDAVEELYKRPGLNVYGCFKRLICQEKLMFYVGRHSCPGHISNLTEYGSTRNM